MKESEHMTSKVTDINIGMIEADWAKDCKIDLTNLNHSSLAQYDLHQKYYKILNFVRRRYRELVSEKKRLYIQKNDYYSNKMAPKEMKDLDWEPNKRIIMKTDLDKWIDCDDHMIDLNLKIGEYGDMVTFAEDIIQSINRRSFTIKNIIETQKFLNGIQ